MRSETHRHDEFVRDLPQVEEARAEFEVLAKSRRSLVPFQEKLR